MQDFFVNTFAHAALRGIPSNIRRIVFTLVLVIFVCSISVTPGCPPGSQKVKAAGDDLATPSVSCIGKLGLSGAITSDIVVGKLIDSGQDTVFLGTTDGLYVVSNGILRRYIYTPFGVSHVALIDDLTGDGVQEVVFSLKDADVPSVQCYDGATWKRLWQSATRQPMYVRDMGWGNLQIPTAGLEVMSAGDSQIIAISAGRCVFGIDAASGRRLWTFAARDNLQGMAIVSDTGRDGVDDVVVGENSGVVYLISGKTGKAKWSKKIAEKYQPDFGQPQQAEVTDVVTYDRDAGKVVVAAGDGKVRLLDLRSKRCEWQQSVASGKPPTSLCVMAASDVDSDGEPEILVTDFTGGAGRGSVGLGAEPAQAVATLLSGRGGDQVWQKYLYARQGADLELSYYQEQPVILEPQKDSTARLISLKNGDLLGCISVKTLDGAAILIRRFTADSYVVVSDGSDLSVVSSSGTQQWCYPRIAESSVYEGQLTGDSTPDILVCGYSEQPTDQTVGIRILSVIDRANHREVWRYEIPCSDFMTLGGLTNVQVAPDLTGDGFQDILAYRGNIIYFFSGVNGFLVRLDIHANIAHLETMKVGSITAVLVGTKDGIRIIGVNGNELWSSSYAEWGTGDLGVVRVLGDLNGDRVGDLVILLTDSVVVAKSNGTSPLDFVLSRSISAGDNKIIEFLEITADINGDGICEIAYIEYDRQAFLDKGIKKDKALMVMSPSCGTALLRLNLDREAVFDLACADFNGDRVLDSLVCWGRKQGGSDKPKLEVYSGKDGSILWTFLYGTERFRQTPEMTAISVGDITGDGIADLALSELMRMDRMRLSVYDIARNSLAKQITIPPLEDKQTGWFTGPDPGGAVHPIGDLDGDGKQELAIPVYHSRGAGSFGQYVALIDMGDESLLACFPFLSPDFFKSGEAGLLGVAQYGGVFLLRVGEPIQVTSPAPGRTVGSPSRIAWEGAGESDFADIFVDGVRSGAILGTSIRLPLTSGKHEVTVRSIDEYGKISYGTVTFKVRQLPLASIAGVFGLIILLMGYSYARLARVVRNRRAQKDMK